MIRSPLLVLAAALTIVACRCEGPTDPDGEDIRHWALVESLGELGLALTSLGDEVVVAVDDGLLRSSDGGANWTRLEATGLAPGTINFLHLLPGFGEEGPVLMAGVFGMGLYRSTDFGATFDAPDSPPSPGLMSMFNPRARVMPFGMAGDVGAAWLGGLGGIYYSLDGGDRWNADVDLFSTGSMNVLFTDIAVHENRVAAVAMLADAILPAEQQGVLAGVLFVSDDGGDTWTDASSDAPFEAPTGVVIDGEAVLVSAMDGGLFKLEGGAWTRVGGPNDALAIGSSLGGFDIASASRGMWRYEDGDWSQAGQGAVVAISGDLALGHDGSLYRLVDGIGVVPPDPAGGRVHIALSFHVNLYHSYRGDTLDDDGFGMDLRVLRRVLDWLDEYPEVRADWDIENAFSVDDWLVEHGPDILERIRERRERGHDGIRLMSWNNGAMAAKSKEEFEAAVRWGLESYVEAFGSYDPGVQPQECMITPEHLGWYRELGIEWITLFNSASAFTALKPEVSLTGSQRYNPVRLAGSLESDGEMTLVPVYHHADVLSHGGLAAWARQISDSHAGDSLLVIHMDGDAEVWEAFDAAIEQVYDLDFVRFTTIQDYLDEHEPVGSVVLHGDLADGMDDGFQSWAEKNINFELFTEIARARRQAAIARVVFGVNEGLEALIEPYLQSLLLSLSTTHFGLASPNLHPDREASARAHIQDAHDHAKAMLDASLATLEFEANEIVVVNYRQSGGPALVEIASSISAEEWEGPGGLKIRDSSGAELPALVEFTAPESEGDEVLVRASVVLEVAPLEIVTLIWDYDPSVMHAALGDVDSERLLGAEVISVPFTECLGTRTDGVSSGVGEVFMDERGMRAILEESFDLALCGAAGTVMRRASVFHGLPGVVIEVEASMGSPSRPQNAESVALSPLVCSNEASELTWRTFGGTVRSRPARSSVRVWNGQAVDGWLSMLCGEEEHQVAHHTTTRSSMASYPLRNAGGSAILAPLGTLWGEPAWHDAPMLGGHPIGDAAVQVVGAQFRPSAPDWSGETIRYRLLIGSGELPADVLDLFAHPPASFVGSGR